MQLRRLGDRLFAARRFAGQLEALGSRDDGPRREPERELIVHDEDGDTHRPSILMSGAPDRKGATTTTRLIPTGRGAPP